MTAQCRDISHLYHAKIASGELLEDKAQLQAVSLLSELQQQLQHKKPWWQTSASIKGVYLYGEVGRGKSMLMDLFFNSLGLKNKQRLHFHHFMQFVHQQLALHQGQKNPLSLIAVQFAKHTKVLCFDEFFVSDIGDAMIMANLFSALFRCGVVLVTTSNCAPEQLYKNGLQRARFLPTIKLLNEHCHVCSVAGEVDHRFRFYQQYQHYFSQAETSLSSVFCSRYHTALQPQKLCILGRTINAKCISGKAVLFDFTALCSGARSSQDYITLAQQFNVIYVENVPQMGAKMQQKQVALGTEEGYIRAQTHPVSYHLDDEARRFIALIDECYDQQKLVVLSASVPIEQLYIGQRLAFEFQRTVSRLVQMQT